ncbi:rotatin isoform X2 [Orussus abietinus]|uniref:rotatin isoform X2 n=1 Tax=Orussus abietinus TaxID=222816 RepID=UPI000625A081|nr:rotatin isoform X2 [Orussus abietinus]
MSQVSGITSVHVKKLGHSLEEIRSRALDSIISKIDHGFTCDCDALRKELILKLLNWFSFDTVPHPDKALYLLLRLIQFNGALYLNAFGKLRFQNELHELRCKLDSTWHDILNQIEEAVLNAKQFLTTENVVHPLKVPVETRTYRKEYEDNSNDNEFRMYDNSHTRSIFTLPSSSANTTSIDLTLECENGTPVSKQSEGGVRWLVMPWQPLVTSDRGVLSAVEEALNNVTDTSLIIHTCQFITNVMLQDFPAEVFLQRPAIVLVLHTLIQTNGNICEDNVRNVASTVLKTLYKLTRSLRFRIYYYCDPCVANKKQKLLARNLESSASIDDRDSPEGVPEANYQAYQSAGTSERSHSITDNVDESVLQLQQMSIPIYCISSLKHAISLLSIPSDPSLPLKDIKYITDLSYELIQLLITSIVPTIWISNDSVSLKIHEDLKALLKLFGEVIEYFGNYSSVDYFRVTYLHLLSIITKLLSNIVPLEIADAVLPKPLKSSICLAVMDASIYLMYPTLHTTLQEYARHFHGTEELEFMKQFDETRSITKSLRATVSVIKGSTGQSESDILKAIYASKMSLSYHKNLSIIKKFIQLMQNVTESTLSTEDKSLATKLTLGLLAYGDVEIQRMMYKECHRLISDVLGVEYHRERHSWENIQFLFQPGIMTEIICHGVMNEDEEIKSMAEDILIYMLKGRLQLGETGWLKFLESIVPVLALLQCHAHTSTILGQCVTKMLDPDISSRIQLPYIEVLKGNIRLLFSPDSDIREEALCRLVWLLGKEKDSIQKLPKLSSLHGLPLSSLCIFERQTSFKRSEGNYQRSSLLSVLEMLNGSNVEPKMRKSALVQISVMLTDTSLHKLFITENGLALILKIFSKALMEKEYSDYPDSVIPIIRILKLITSTDTGTRLELSNRIDVFLNILRSLFLYPNNEGLKVDASHLLCLLIYNEYIMKLGDKHLEKQNELNISLPYIIVSQMRLPFYCRAHWKTSINRRSDVSVLHSSNPLALTFVRQFWVWEWHNGLNVLWKSWDSLNNMDTTEKLIIGETDFAILQYSFPHYCCQQKLYSIQNSTTHNGVFYALDYLTMYLKLYNMLSYDEVEDLNSLPWAQSFERFLLSHPTSKEDYELFVNVLSFLYIYINVMKNGKVEWLCKVMKNMTKSLADILRNVDTNNQDVHQAVLKLARACSAVEKSDERDKESRGTWINFIELVVSNLCFGDQQHFYNLAYLDGLLTCLTYLTSKCQWSTHKNLLVSLGNALVELIISFHGAGTVSYMGLSITRNSIICLNHLLHQMQTNLNKSMWTTFWYVDGRSLTWLPMLWRNRDPLVRASALQLLAGLTNFDHTAPQLLNAMALAPSELCQTLLRCIINREESCIVREQACIALSNIVKRSASITFQYADSLQPTAIVIYIEQNNVYYEISLLVSNIYTSSTLDPDSSNEQEGSTKAQSLQSGVSGCMSALPRTVSNLYDCHDELQLLSVKGSEITEDENYPQFIATPSLITAVCSLLNNLISIGHYDVIRQFHEHRLDRYFFGCFTGIPKNDCGKRDLTHYCDILEMYIGLCTVLTNCIVQSNEYSAIVSVSPDSLYYLLTMLNNELYHTYTSRLIYLRNRLWTEVFNFFVALSITEGQHFEPIQTALELCGPEVVLTSICMAMKSSTWDLRMSAIAALAFLLSSDIQREAAEKDGPSLLQHVLDTIQFSPRDCIEENDMRDVLSKVNELSIRSANAHTKRSATNEDEARARNDRLSSNRQEYTTVGSEICRSLLQLYLAHNYAKSKKNHKQSKDKDIVVGALTNLLCISSEAKRTALEENLVETSLILLKEFYVKLNFQSFELYKNQSDRDKKMHPLLHDVNCIFILLMNFMYGNVEVKEVLAKAGLADVVHKLWAWVDLNKTVVISALKLLATFTTHCPEAGQSLTLTTTLPGTSLRKTPNTVALIHVIAHVVSKEIEKAGQKFDNQKLHFAFHTLRNAVHVHECRVSIAKVKE